MVLYLINKTDYIFDVPDNRIGLDSIVDLETFVFFFDAFFSRHLFLTIGIIIVISILLVSGFMIGNFICDLVIKQFKR